MKAITSSIILCIAIGLNGCQSEGGQAAAKGAGAGAVGGAALGLVLGLLTGDAEVAARATAVGAATGAAYGAAYGYDQHNEDRRNKRLVEAIGGANKGETADEAGLRHLQDFTGDWDVNAWVAGVGDNRVNATASGSSQLVGKTGLTVNYSEFMSDGKEVPLAGQSTISYSSIRGFELNTTFRETGAGGTSATSRFVGEYVPADNVFMFYLVGGDDFTDGKVESNVRLIIRSSGRSLWFGETYATIDGKERQIENLRLVRR